MASSEPESRYEAVGEWDRQTDWSVRSSSGLEYLLKVTASGTHFMRGDVDRASTAVDHYVPRTYNRRTQLTHALYTVAITTRATKFLSISLPNINQFWQFFYCQTLRTICDKTVFTDFITLKPRRYTTLWNINFQKLHQPKQSNVKISAHKLKKMWSW